MAEKDTTKSIVTFTLEKFVTILISVITLTGTGLACYWGIKSSQESFKFDLLLHKQETKYILEKLENRIMLLEKNNNKKGD